jgi:hypothetical protein
MMVHQGQQVILGLPQDQETQAAIGIISIRHGQLDNSLRWTIGKLVGLSRQEMLDATARKGSQELREIIHKLVRHHFGVTDDLVKTDALLNRVKRVTEKRNDILHNLWGYILDHGAVIRREEDHQFEDVPSVAALNAIADEITAVTRDLNLARIEGFLFEAIQNKKRL